MKSRLTKFRMTLATVCGIALASGVVAFRAQADQWDKKTILTIDQPVQITDTYLEPGTYVMKLANSSSDRHIVQIFNEDQSHIINTVMAIPNYRLRPTGDSRFMFWETPPGTAAAMRAWFYPGDNFGQEFRYPKEPKQLASAQTAKVTYTPAPPPAPAPEAPAATSVEPPAPAPVTEAPAVTTVEPSTLAPQALSEPAEEPILLAQNNPPPLPAPTPAASQPDTLPKTGSPYPLVGFAGAFSLVLYGLLRAKRLA